MCGRYGLSLPAEELSALLGGVEVPDEYVPSYNVAPGQFGWVARAADTGDQIPSGPALVRAKWGLQLSQNADGTAPRPINARSESVATRGVFRDAFRRGRCLVPASGFFEWRRGPAGKVPYWIHGSEPLLFAAISITSLDDVISYAVLTRPSPVEIARIHDRAPVVLGRPAADAWLDRSTERRQLDELMRDPSPSLQAHPVSTRVNRVDQDDPDLLKVEPEPLELLLE